jgi:hypothetical protein
VLAALGYRCWRVYDRALLVRADLRAIQAATGAQRDRAMLASLGALLAKTRGDTAALHAEAGLFLPITRYLGWVPVYGADLVAAEPLLDAAVDLSAAADDAFVAFGPLLAADGSSPLTSAQIQSRIVAARPQIDSAGAAIERALPAWSQIQIDGLSPALRGQLRPVDQALPLLRLGLHLAPRLPSIVEDLELLDHYAKTSPDKAALTALGPLLAKTRADFGALRDAAAPLLPAAATNQATTGDAADLPAALLDTAAELAVAADESFRALSPIMLDRKADRPIGVVVMQQLTAARPQIATARQAAARASAAWARIRLDALAPALRDQLLPITGRLAALRDGLDLADALPGLLGANGPVDYLLLAQNPDELRATGGFISAVGILTIDHGGHGAIEMQNSPTVDDIVNQVYPEPPKPLLRYMNSEMWLFRDSNWSPDFPTSAKLARELYALGQRREYANVIAFDPLAVEQLLAAIGPVMVAESPEPISAKNVTAYLRSEHDLAQGAAKKAYIGRLANAMAAQIEFQPGQVDLWKLLTALHRALSERHLLLALADTTVAPIAARHGWDGAVQPGAADFLMVVDSNVGYNKVNPNISQAISYTVDLSDPSAPVATLDVRYVHNLKLPDTCKQFDDAETSYTDWMRRCYYDYLRVLVPHDSQLTGATSQPVPDAWMDSGAGDDGGVTASDGEAGTRVLSTFVVVPFGEQRVTSLRYRLPAAVLTRDAQGWHYRLHIQKQAGTGALPLTIDLRLPPRAALIEAIPLPAARTGGSLHFAGSLAQDRTFEITFQL